MEKYNPVEGWITNVAYAHSPSKSTAHNYRLHLSKFCSFIGKTPKEIIDEYEESIDKIFRRKYAQYIRALISQMTNKGYAVNSINSQVAAIKSFFRYSDLPLAHVATAKSKVQYHNRDILKEEIVLILQASSPRDKAFFTLMAQGGFRPHILCSLKIKDIQPDYQENRVPCCVKVSQEINKGGYGPFFTFVGEESVKYLKAYLSTRFHTTPEDLLFMSRGTTKPLNPKSLSHIFNHILTKLKEKGTIKLEESQVGKPGKLRLYNLRKYFRKYARPAGIDYVNYWMGHKSNYKASHIPSSDDSYFSKEDVEFQRSTYGKDAAPHLRLETPVRTAVGERMELLSSKVEELRKDLTETKSYRDMWFQRYKEERELRLELLKELPQIHETLAKQQEEIRRLKQKKKLG